MGKRDTVKGAIVGCGSVARTSHIPIFRALKDVEIVALCDKKENVALQTARRWGIPRIYVDFSQVLADKDLDFLDICSPPQTHFSLSMQAMKAGLHVLVEKPMALGVSEADKMISISKKNKVKLCVVHNFLFSPTVQKAKPLVDAGAIGDLVSVEVMILARRDGIIRRKDHWCHSLPRGILCEYVPHALYLESAFFGHINSVQAIAHKQSNFPWVTADELRVLLKGENSSGGLTISCNSPKASFTMNIFGTKRILHLDNFAMTMIQHKSGVNRIRDLVIDDLRTSLGLAIGAGSTLWGAFCGQKWYRTGHCFIIQRFIESLRNDIELPVSAEDGRETVRHT